MTRISITGMFFFFTIVIEIALIGSISTIWFKEEFRAHSQLIEDMRIQYLNSGIDNHQVDRFVEKSEELLRNDIKYKVVNISIFTVLLLIITIFFTFLIAIRIKKDFTFFNDFFSNISRSRQKIDTDDIVIKELYLFALNMNTMMVRKGKYEKEKQELTDKLVYKNKELEQILFTASYDLRTPAVNIHGFSNEIKLNINEILKIISGESDIIKIRQKIQPIIDNELYENINYILTSGDRITALLNGLTKFIQTGKADILLSRVNMQQLVEDIINDFHHHMDFNNVRVEVKELPDCVTDINLIKEVFSNIIENGIKFSDPTKDSMVTVSGEVGDDKITYCVEDNGLGIIDDQQDKIFTLFYKRTPRLTSGEGVGLAIVERIMARLHGEICIESEVGEGSRFYIILSVVPEKKQYIME